MPPIPVNLSGLWRNQWIEKRFLEMVCWKMIEKNYWAHTSNAHAIKFAVIIYTTTLRAHCIPRRRSIWRVYKRTSVSSRLFYTWPPRTSNCGPALWASPAAHMHHQNWKQNTSALHVHAMTTVSLMIIILSMTLWHKQTIQLCALDYIYVLTLSIAKEFIQLLRSNLLAAIPRVAWLILCYPLFL